MDADYNSTGDTSLKHSYDWTFYWTHHRDKEATQYVHVDVSSVCQISWMFYYTHHSNMDAPKYVHVDVYSTHFFE
jgi:hypothetical protein